MSGSKPIGSCKSSSVERSKMLKLLKLEEVIQRLQEKKTQMEEIQNREDGA